MGITHSKVSAIADGGDTTLVRPSDWNADHVGTDAHFLVIASSHSTPLVFDDIVQTSAGDDLVYTS